jgi:hypothetical protein
VLSSYPFDISPAKPPVGARTETSSILSVGQQTKWRKQRGHLFALALWLLIIILTLPFTLNFLSQTVSVIPQKKPSDISSTQIAQRQATATGQVQAQATLAAQARAQTTADITPPINYGKILYHNAMTSPGGGWIDDGRQCAFSRQGYAVSTYTPHTVAWCYSNQQHFSDAIITVQACLIRGDFYGIVFRLQPGNDAFYVLELNSTGQYRFQRAEGNNPNYWLTLIDWTPSGAIATSYGQRNSIIVIANGTNFRFYINQHLIISTFSDNAYATGLIGLLVGGDSIKGTEALFSNVIVFQK